MLVAIGWLCAFVPPFAVMQWFLDVQLAVGGAILLAAAVLLGGADVFGIFGLLGTVAAIVYLVDVRPAVRELKRGGPWG